MIHVAALIGVGRGPREEPLSNVVSERIAELETEVDFDQAPLRNPAAPADPEAASLPVAPSLPTAAEREGARAAIAASSGVADPGRRRDTGGGNSASTTDPTSSSDATAWVFSPTMSGAAGDAGALSGDGLAEATRDGVRAMLADEAKKAPPRAADLPRFSQRDLDLGLAPGGHLLSLAREQVRRSLVPDVSKALLEITTDSAGVVASVQVLEASSGRQEWNAIATGFLASAREKPVRVPSGAKGLVITIEVTSALKTVSGSTPSAGPIAKVWGALNNPVDTLADSRTAPQRVVTGRMVGVDLL